jgi:flagellar basal-body rod modification protein FlgD
MPISADASLNKMDFLTLLTTQLRYQDPTSPTDQEAFISQLSQFSMLESIQELNDSFGQMLKLQEISQSVNLVGKSIEFFNTSTGDLSRGRVSEITVNDGRISAVVDDQLIDIGLIKSISE